MRVVSYLYIFLFLCCLLPKAYSCEERRIREPVSGFGLGTKLHPDYAMAKSHNSQFPNLGTEDKKFCDGVEKIGVYAIYPTGAISVVYRELDDRWISKYKHG